MLADDKEESVVDNNSGVTTDERMSPQGARPLKGDWSEELTIAEKPRKMQTEI